MSMTRDEAITNLEKLVALFRTASEQSELVDYSKIYESIIFCSERGFEFVGKRPQDIIKCRRVLPNELKHPNEKPVRLLEELICKCTHKCAVVLDLFMGSGSTGVACVNTGRKFIGMELDPEYFEVAKRRIEEAQAQARLAWNTRAPILSSEEMEKLSHG